MTPAVLRYEHRYGRVSAMPFLRHVPAPPLSAHIDCLWFHEGPGAAHAKERLLPTGELELIINLAEDQVRFYDSAVTDRAFYRRGAVICGVHSGFFVIDTAEQTSVMGVHFRPGGAAAFFRPPTSEFSNTHVDLDRLWGEFANELRGELAALITPAARFARLEAALLGQLQRDVGTRHPVVWFALQAFSDGPRSVAEVSAQTGFSSRRFSQVFAENVGLTPKLYWRVRRFQEVIGRLRADTEPDWVALALDCGYYDQAHFIHDFREFSGLTPGEYLALCTPHQNHVPLKD